MDAAVAEGLAAIEEATLAAAAPPVAIERFLDLSWQLSHRYPILLDPTFARIRGADGHDPHHAVIGVLEQIIRRGQQSGNFDRRLPAPWLVTATFSLGHAAAEQITAKRLAAHEAAKILLGSVLRLYGSNRA